jgi:hypothetical protein
LKKKTLKNLRTLFLIRLEGWKSSNPLGDLAEKGFEGVWFVRK